MKTALLTAILFSTSFAAWANQPEPNIPSVNYEKRCKILQRRMAQIQQELDDTQKMNRRFRTLCKKNGIKITQLEEQENSNEINEGIELQINKIAYLSDNQSIQIRQIVDKSNMLATITLGYRTIYSRIDPRDSHLTMRPVSGYEPINRLIWIKGVDTSNRVNGNEIKIYAPLKVTGTKTYDTTDSSTNTVFILEPYIASP